MGKKKKANKKQKYRMKMLFCVVEGERTDVFFITIMIMASRSKSYPDMITGRRLRAPKLNHGTRGKIDIQAEQNFFFSKSFKKNRERKKKKKKRQEKGTQVQKI
jgi:hypothetical protein